jgi:hypothetical protein
MNANQYVTKMNIVKQIKGLQKELLMVRAATGALVGLTLLSSFSADWMLTLFGLSVTTISLIAGRMTESHIEKLEERIFQLRIK